MARTVVDIPPTNTPDEKRRQRDLVLDAIDEVRRAMVASAVAAARRTNGGPWVVHASVNAWWLDDRANTYLVSKTVCGCLLDDILVDPDGSATSLTQAG